jgi:hypothetical protein
MIGGISRPLSTLLVLLCITTAALAQDLRKSQEAALTAPSLATAVIGGQVDAQTGVPFHLQLAQIGACGPYVYALNSATIDWGDQTPADGSTGGFVGPAYTGAFFGSHTYTSPGTFTIQITVNEQCFNVGAQWTSVVSGLSKTIVHSPMPVASLSVTGPVQGGSQTTGNVILSAPAPKGGVLVILDVPDPNSQYVSVPASVVVPEGQKTLPNAFPVTTKVVPNSPTTVTVSAYSGAALVPASKPVTTRLRIN